MIKMYKRIKVALKVLKLAEMWREDELEFGKDSEPLWSYKPLVRLHVDSLKEK